MVENKEYMKDIIEFMRNRVSQADLTQPAPTKEEWREILTAASRAADHANLQPWRYRIYQGKGLDKLGECYWQHARSETADMPDSKRDNFIQKAHRAPAVLLVYASLQEHPKVPVIEQTMTVAAATQQVLLGLNAKGYGAIWRSGPVAHSERTKALLGLQQQDQIIGFIYVGTGKKAKASSKNVSLEGRLEWCEE